MVLRWRLILMLSIALAVYVGLDSLVQTLVVYPRFLKLEQAYADEDLQRCYDAFYSEIQHLRQFTNDWAAWDDTYSFIQTGAPQYIAANFVKETFLENSLNVMFACRLDGTVVYGEALDLHTQELLELADLPPDKLPANSPLLLPPGDMTGRGGVVLLDGRPTLVAIMPILTTYAKGPSRGVLIFGKFIDQTVVEALSEQIHVQLDVRTIEEAQLLPEYAEAVAAAPRQAPFLHHIETQAQRHIHGIMPDLTGAPALLLTVDTSRDISAEGRSAMLNAILSDTMASLSVILLLILAIDLIVTRRVGQLHQDVTQVGLSGNLSARLPIRGKDEIAELSKQVNSMLASLERTEQARLASEKQTAELETLQSAAATYAHEINNPLTGILGLAQLLLDDDMEAQDCRELLGDIMEAAVRIRDVIRKMEQLTEVRFKPYFGATEILDLTLKPDPGK